MGRRRKRRAATSGRQWPLPAGLSANVRPGPSDVAVRCIEALQPGRVEKPLSHLALNILGGRGRATALSIHPPLAPSLPGSGVLLIVVGTVLLPGVSHSVNHVGGPKPIRKKFSFEVRMTLLHRSKCIARHGMGDLPTNDVGIISLGRYRKSPVVSDLNCTDQLSVGPGFFYVGLNLKTHQGCLFRTLRRFAYPSSAC